MVISVFVNAMSVRVRVCAFITTKENKLSVTFIADMKVFATKGIKS